MHLSNQHFQHFLTAQVNAYYSALTASGSNIIWIIVGAVGAGVVVLAVIAFLVVRRIRGREEVLGPSLTSGILVDGRAPSSDRAERRHVQAQLQWDDSP